MCPQMSPFVLICHITRYFTAFLIPVTLQPKGIGQANQAPAAGSVPISAKYRLQLEQKVQRHLI